jgi:hypothetical protein
LELGKPDGSTTQAGTHLQREVHQGKPAVVLAQRPSKLRCGFGLFAFGFAHDGISGAGLLGGRHAGAHATLARNDLVGGLVHRAHEDGMRHAVGRYGRHEFGQFGLVEVSSGVTSGDKHRQRQSETCLSQAHPVSY